MSRVTINPDKMAALKNRTAIAALDQWFAGEVAKGFSTESGITLGLGPEDVSLLTGNYVLAKEAAALGMSIPPLIDTNGTAHPMAEIEELTAIMLAYGQHRAALSAEYATRKAAIEAGE